MVPNQERNKKAWFGKWQHGVRQTKYIHISKFPFLSCVYNCTLPTTTTVTSKLPFLIHLFYSQATLAVCVCETLKIIIINTREWKRETKIARECGLLAEKGHLGFHLLPQLKMLLKGLMGLASLLLLQVLFFYPLKFWCNKKCGFCFLFDNC